MRTKEWAAAVAVRERPQEVNAQISQKDKPRRRRRQGDVAIFVRRSDGTERRLELGGRLAQVVAALARAGERGTTPLDFAAGVRLAALVHRLKREHGLRIESTPETHQTPWGSHGVHSRYRLLDAVRLEAP